MNKYRATYLLAILAIWVPFLAGCLNDPDNCVPSGNCTTAEPTVAGLVLNLTINAENPSVAVEIYSGDVTDSNLYFVDTVALEQVRYDVPINQRFSAIAKYKRANLTILAVDGDRTDLKRTDDCGDTCYEVTDATLNLKLAN